MATAPPLQMQSAPLVVASQQPHQQLPPPPPPVGPIKCLAILQFLIGLVTGVLGIATMTSLYANTVSTKTGAGIWAGGWILVTGLVGICSTRNRNGLNGVYLAFSIISTCVSVLAGLFFVIGYFDYIFADECYSPDGRYDESLPNQWAWDCNYRNVGLGLHIPLAILMVIEFFVSVIAEVYCCRNGCCRNQTQGVVLQQQPYMPVVTATGPPTMITSSGYPINVQYPTQMAPQQYVGQGVPQYGTQMAPQHGVQMQPQYNSQVPPPYNPSVADGGAYPPLQANITYPEKPPAYNTIVHN